MQFLKGTCVLCQDFRQNTVFSEKKRQSPTENLRKRSFKERVVFFVQLRRKTHFLAKKGLSLVIASF